MKLWILERREDLPRESDPWFNNWDKMQGFVIRAETEQDARRIATEEGADEINEQIGGNSEAWLSSDYSTCQELLPEGEENVVLESFAAA